MLWTEFLISYIPIDKKSFWQQMFARFLILLFVWLTGLIAYSLDGLSSNYVTNPNVSLLQFGSSFIILFGSYQVQQTLNPLIQNIRPMLKLDDQLFQEFSQRVKRYSYSFLPCIVITVGILFLSGTPYELSQALAEGFKLHVIWNFFYAAFFYLLTGTALWMFVSIWITIFLISRQPLDVKLSPETIGKFRDLSMLALWFALGYFLGLSISIIVNTLSTGAPALTILEIILSPYLFYILLGIFGVLFPFYNIHRTLVKLKKRELSEIEEESKQLLQHLDEVLANEDTSQDSDQIITIMARLFSLQVTERHVMAAQEWPIDISFLSALIGLGFTPIISKIAVEVISRYF
jgi:MFS family permease